MTDAKDNSSLPLLMSITGAVLVVAVGGWFFLDQEAPQEERSYQPPPELVAATQEPAAVEETTVKDQVPATADAATEEPASEITGPGPTNTASVGGAEAELRKARLAADADLLIYPVEQSALHYYGQVLATEPGHAVAAAELDAVLANVALTVNQHMGAREYDEAFAISEIVATLRPEHELVSSTQESLDQMTGALVAEAVQNARNGKDAEAEELLVEAARYPGRSAEYFVAIRESIVEIREVREAAELDRANRAQLAENDAKAAWVDSVRAAINASHLISPAGASARDLLDEDNSWAAERTELEAELLDAILMAGSLHIGSYEFDTAEQLIAAGANYPDEKAQFDELSDALEIAYIEYESSQVKKVSELVAVKISQPRYPRAAKMRSTTGWVEVFFTVATDGNTEQIQINRSEPEEIFDEAAVKAVDNWKFEPVEYRGQLISQRAGTRLVFNVE